MDIQVVMMCSAHGMQTWAGHLRCTQCGRMYETETLPDTCACGASLDIGGNDDAAVLRLTYDKTLPVRSKRCFKHFKKKGGGRIPVETRKPS